MTESTIIIIIIIIITTTINIYESTNSTFILLISDMLAINSPYLGTIHSLQIKTKTTTNDIMVIKHAQSATPSLQESLICQEGPPDLEDPEEISKTGNYIKYSSLD